MKLFLISILRLSSAYRTNNSLHYDTCDFLSPTIQQVLKTQREIKDEISLDLIGQLPDWLTGTLYRNGPGLYEVKVFSLIKFFILCVYEIFYKLFYNVFY